MLQYEAVRVFCVHKRFLSEFITDSKWTRPATARLLVTMLRSPNARVFPESNRHAIKQVKSKPRHNSEERVADPGSGQQKQYQDVSRLARPDG